MNTRCHCTNPVTPEPDCPAHGFEKLDAGEGWYILAVGEPLMPGDGFKHPDYPLHGWIDYGCRPGIFRPNEGGNASVHSYPWRRRKHAEPPPVDPYPEHTKLMQVKDKSQACGAFIEWLEAEKGTHLAKYGPGRNDAVLEHNYTPLNRLLAEHFGIDARKLEDEKQAMLDACRKEQAQ